MFKNSLVCFFYYLIRGSGLIATVSTVEKKTYSAQVLKPVPCSSSSISSGTSIVLFHRNWSSLVQRKIAWLQICIYRVASLHLLNCVVYLIQTQHLPCVVSKHRIIIVLHRGLLIRRIKKNCFSFIYIGIQRNRMFLVLLLYNDSLEHIDYSFYGLIYLG